MNSRTTLAAMIAAAAVTGMLSASATKAASTKIAGISAAPMADKSGCGGKDGCGGKAPSTQPTSQPAK